MTARDRQKTIHLISYEPKKRITIFTSLPIKTQIIIFPLLSKNIRKNLFLNLSENEKLALLEALDPDQATDVIQLLPENQAQELLAKLSENIQQSVTNLLQFDPKTAAGIMSLNYVQVDRDQTIAEVVEVIKNHEHRTGRLPTILVLENGHLIGSVAGHKLAYGKKTEKISEYSTKISVISSNADYKNVLEKFRSKPRDKVVVLNEDHVPLGIIYASDVLKVLREQKSSSLYDFAGLNNEETLYDSAKSKVTFRYKWLIINLGTAFLASFTVGLFNETIARNVLLAVYMPIVAGMGGNAATQTLAVLVRGLSSEQPDWSVISKTLKNEVMAGFTNGVINGIIVAIIVYIFNRDIKVALILSAAMVFNLCIAATFGTIVPVIMKKLGKDPATSATIFITTATDVLGFLAFLGLATLIL